MVAGLFAYAEHGSGRFSLMEESYSGLCAASLGWRKVALLVVFSVSLDECLIGGGGTAARASNCPVWGRVFVVTKRFSLLKAVDEVRCNASEHGMWRVEVRGKYSRGVSIRLVFWYSPDHGLSVPRERRRKNESERGWLTQPVAEALYELAAKHSVELDKEGRVYIDGVEVDMWSCASRGAVNFECVLRQVTERGKSHPRILR